MLLLLTTEMAPSVFTAQAAMGLESGEIHVAFGPRLLNWYKAQKHRRVQCNATLHGIWPESGEGVGRMLEASAKVGSQKGLCWPGPGPQLLGRRGLAIVLRTTIPMKRVLVESQPPRPGHWDFDLGQP
jgi:hypothetical protein